MVDLGIFDEPGFLTWAKKQHHAIGRYTTEGPARYRDEEPSASWWIYYLTTGVFEVVYDSVAAVAVAYVSSKGDGEVGGGS